MSKKFKAIVIDNQNEKFSRKIEELDTSSLKDGNVLVKIDYSSLNFKDALILNNGGRIVKNYPFVPGIDFSGTVEESDDGKFKKNDKVILTGLALVSTWTFSPAVIAKSAFLYVTVGCAPCNVLKTKFPAPSVATASPAVAAFVVLRFDAVTDSFEIRLVVFKAIIHPTLH